MLIGKMMSVTVDGRRTKVLVRKRKCRECGNDFQPQTKSSKYCSRSCGKKASRERTVEKDRERARLWYKDHLDEARKKRKERYWSNPEKHRQDTRRWREKNLEREKESQSRSKDARRHGGRRESILEQSNYACSVCGKDTRDGWRDSCVHHETFNSTDHDNQVLVCRNCHAKIHKKLG